MNAVVKYIVTDFVVRKAIKTGARLFEAGLAYASPAKHESYVEYITELADARLDAFVHRNAELAEKFARPENNVEDIDSDEFLKQAAESLAPIIDMIKGNTNDKTT